jgi:predicted  nucleic acid-binding Zn-ribbon protein
MKKAVKTHAAEIATVKERRGALLADMQTALEEMSGLVAQQKPSQQQLSQQRQQVADLVERCRQDVQDAGTLE